MPIAYIIVIVQTKVYIYFIPTVRRYIFSLIALPGHPQTKTKDFQYPRLRKK